MLRIILNARIFFWLILALPGIAMVYVFVGGRIDAEGMLHPTGETSARLMIMAMMLSPLLSLFGPRPWLDWLIRQRRYLGVAAFVYAVLHLVFYVIDMGNLADMIAEFWDLGIWTGWAAFLLMALVAAISNETAVKALMAGWKRLQRLVYPAAVLVLMHWIFVHNDFGPALVHFVPLALLVAARYFTSSRSIYQGI